MGLYRHPRKINSVASINHRLVSRFDCVFFSVGRFVFFKNADENFGQKILLSDFGGRVDCYASLVDFLQIHFAFDSLLVNFMFVYNDTPRDLVGTAFDRKKIFFCRVHDGTFSSNRHLHCFG